MRPLPADRVAETLGVAAAAARKLLAEPEAGPAIAMFPQLSRALRQLEDHRSPAAAQTCAEQFAALRRSLRCASSELSTALDEAHAALMTLAVGEPATPDQTRASDIASPATKPEPAPHSSTRPCPSATARHGAAQLHRSAPDARLESHGLGPVRGAWSPKATGRLGPGSAP